MLMWQYEDILTSEHIIHSVAQHCVLVPSTALSGYSQCLTERGIFMVAGTGYHALELTFSHSIRIMDTYIQTAQ